jgi:formate hydrogenlyase subunit 6/NADH:ubiquinone oxidoreductase subunit I
MDGFSETESFYCRFVKKLRDSWTVVAPVMAADGVCRLQETNEVAGLSCSCLPLLPLKKILLPPSEPLWSLAGRSYQPLPAPPFPIGIALIDVAPCDLYALAYLDQAFAEDPFYQERRQRLLLIGRECSPSSYCHCPPHAAPPSFDLFFAGDDVWSGSALGKKVLQEFAGAMLPRSNETLPLKYWAGQVELPIDLAARFLQSADDPLWAEVARRCLSCGACSAACPTCACYDVVDEASLSGELKRQRVWDNCFFRDHGLVAGGHNFRPDRTARLRFRFEHKYLGFGEQRGIISCVGCGRCQRVCPVEINLAHVLEKLPALEER